jgi:hypothetical protein
MLQWYTTSIFNRAANSTAASHYYFLLCLLEDGDKQNTSFCQLCYDWLIDLVLETAQIDTFFGTLDWNGDQSNAIRQPGFLDSFLPIIRIYSWDEFKAKLIRPAAVRAERRSVSALQHAENSTEIGGDDVDIQENNAILLFNLAEDYDTVLDMLSRRVHNSLNEVSLETVCDAIMSTVKRQEDDTSVVMLRCDSDMERLGRAEKLASSVLDFYVSRTHILTKLSNVGRKTLNTLIHLVAFYKCVISVAQSILDSSSNFSAAVEVKPHDAGFGLRLGSRRGTALSLRTADWNSGLILVEDLGLVPLGLTRKSTTSRMGTPQMAPFGTPSRPSLFSNGTPSYRSTPSLLHRSSTPGSHAASQEMAVADVDYARIMTRAENLRREFDDMILTHLPDVFLGVELLIWVGAMQTRASSSGMEDDSSLLDGEWGHGVLAKKSRQVMSFVSAVGRWYKVPAETRRRLLAMDEQIMA